MRGQVEADYHDTVRTIIFTGRPMRVRKNAMIMNWEENRQAEIRELTAKGVLPMAKQREEDEGKEMSFQDQMDRLPLLKARALERLAAYSLQRISWRRWSLPPSPLCDRPPRNS